MALRPPVSIGRAERDHSRSGSGHTSGAFCPASPRWRRCLSPPGCPMRRARRDLRRTHHRSSRPVLCRSGDRTRLRGWSAAFRREGAGDGHGGRALGTRPQEGACDGLGRCGETMTRPLRLLFLLPFAPDLRGAHGGTRATAAIIDMLSRHHRLTVLYLAAPGDPPPRQLPASCERILAIPMEKRAIGPRSESNGISGSRGGFCGLDQTGSKNAGRRSWPVGRPQSLRSSSQTSPIMSSTSWLNISHSYVRSVRGRQPSSPSMNRGSSLTRSGTHRRRFESGSPDWRGVGHGVAMSAASSAWRNSIIVFTSSDAAALESLLGSSRPPISVVPLRLPAPDSPRRYVRANKVRFRIRGQFPPSAQRRRGAATGAKHFPHDPAKTARGDADNRWC